jgi:hypothetical protein
MNKHRVHLLAVFFLTIGLTGCSSSFQGIRMRIQSPPVDESCRKISLALTTDGYVLSKVDPVNHQVGMIQSRILVRLEPRGRLFDLYLTPLLRYFGGDAWEGRIAGVKHPLRVKWQQALTRLLEKEAKEED